MAIINDFWLIEGTAVGSDMSSPCFTNQLKAKILSGAFWHQFHNAMLIQNTKIINRFMSIPWGSDQIAF